MGRFLMRLGWALLAERIVEVISTEEMNRARRLYRAENRIRVTIFAAFHNAMDAMIDLTLAAERIARDFKVWIDANPGEIEESLEETPAREKRSKSL